MDTVKLVEVEQRSKSNTKRLDNIDRQIEEMHELMKTVASLTTEIRYMREEFNDGLSRLSKLEKRPLEKYDNIMKYIATTILGLIIGALWKGVSK